MADEALKEQRKIAAHDPRDLMESTLLSLTLVTSAEIADALGQRNRAENYLDEAEKIYTAVYNQNRKEVTAAMPLSRVWKSWAAHWKKAGDEAQAKPWLEKEQRLWSEFPEQNEFVKRQLAVPGR